MVILNGKDRVLTGPVLCCVVAFAGLHKGRTEVRLMTTH